MSWPRFAPGSVMWLLQHELRIFLYGLGQGNAKAKGKNKRGMSRVSWISIAGLALIVHALVFTVMHNMPPMTALPKVPILAIGSGAMLFALSLMTAYAIRSCISALFERGDLDLLMSAPLPSQSIFTVRLLGICIGVMGIFLLLFLPIANVGLLLGQWRWMGIYPVVVSLAVLASSLSMLLTLGLVKLLGIRRAKSVAQVFSALVGAGFFIMSQIPQHLDKGHKKVLLEPVMTWFGGHIGQSDSWLWIPAQALFGEPLPILLVCGVALLSFVVTVNVTHRFFVRGVQQASGVTRKRTAARPLQFHFRQGVWRNMLIKEWRLLLRDTKLLSEILLQVLYMAPAALIILSKNDFSLINVGLALTFLSSMMASSLIWVTVSGEDAPDLLRTAPIQPRQVKQAKFAAAVLPVIALLLPLYGTIMFNHFWHGLLMLVVALLAICSACLINLWLAKPNSRQHFKRRGQGNVIGHFLEIFSSMGWVGCLALLFNSSVWSPLPLVVVVVVLATAWLMRNKENQ